MALRQVLCKKRVSLGRTRMGLAAKVLVNGLHTLLIRSVYVRAQFKPIPSVTRPSWLTLCLP